MEPPSSPSSTITAPPDNYDAARRLAKMSTEAMVSSTALLHYDNTSGSMVEWCWPADSEGKKILPSNFGKHRDEYEFRYPCCLCADGGGKAAYVEAAVYPWWNNTMKQTQWTARCASDKCGYQEVRVYSAAVLHHTDGRIDDQKPPIPPVRFEWTLQEQKELLNRLAECDVIAEKEFRMLFKRCKTCMRVAARSTMKGHICSSGVRKRGR
ncbi:hypothetical protein P692DRAFT_20722120 [Suillus brevipes Sb2]|nr:hypothetical protein P692DRAFT_20722120 [Suillus brevipes Sb2]